MSSPRILIALLALLFGLSTAACGGGGGGPGPSGAGQGLILVSFAQAGQDNVPINRVLRFTFSEPVAPTSIGPASIQIRRGDAFGLTVPGEFQVNGAEVRFRPRLAGNCDLSDTGLAPDTQYRVVIVGHPEVVAVTNTKSQPLTRTATFEFRTRADSDPLLFEDAAPGVAPSVVTIEPEAGLIVNPGAPAPSAIEVRQGSRIVVVLSENVQPCTVNSSTVLLRMFERGDPTVFTTAPNGRATGFASATDAAPANDFSWGPGNTAVSPPQVIPSRIRLIQDFDLTQIVITPNFGEYPDNALLVLELSFGIRDYAGQPLAPTRFSFTTENRPMQTGSLTVDFEGDIPIDNNETTADVNSARAPSKAQGFLLFAGDGNNGTNLTAPAGPAPCFSQVNDPLGKTVFDPDPAFGDVILNTGGVRNTCTNQTDGSRAVVFEFKSFRIRNGLTVRIVGLNPAIILSQGDVLIENGGRLLARGDGIGSAPNSNGGNGQSSGTTAAVGGKGVAGGGDGGNTYRTTDNKEKGDDGFAGFGSASYGTAGAQGGTGAGQGGSATASGNTSGQGSSQGGGGGGHATAGTNAGGAPGPGTSWFPTPVGMGGATYGSLTLPKAESGSGGGGAGDYDHTSSTTFESTGGAGGAGGGFVDLTSQGNILVFGVLDAAGGRGGAGGSNATWAEAGGGGGGSGGGIRLLTPREINVTGGTITAAGGVGGSAARPLPTPNVGGPGGSGRVVMEDGDSIITGFTLATVVPGEGAEGFYRGVFDAGRFQGGGTEPQVTSQAVLVGPLAADFLDPVQADFQVGLPAAAVRPSPGTAILLEAQGYPILPDGGPDLASPTGWYTLGHFRDSGGPAPTWFGNANPTDVPPIVNSGIGFGFLNGSAFIQLRLTFYLPAPPAFGPFDPGPFVDQWVVRFRYDQ